MWFNSRESKVEEYLEEIKKYKSEEFDHDEIDRIRNKLVKSSSSVKPLIKDLNRKIDIDFINESDVMENSGDLKLSEFVKDPAVKILESLPLELVDKERLKELEGDNYEEKIKELYSKIILEASNTRTGEVIKITNVTHLCALRNILESAKSAALKNRKGKDAPLTHYMIMEANAGVFSAERGKSATCGAYRSPYTSGVFFKVTDAKWNTAKPGEVSDKMDALLEWYNNHSQGLHPIVRAAILHTEFIKIHPFEDGNGRTARLLVNYELAKSGYPTVVIKAKDKNKYIEALEEGILTKDVTKLVELIADAVLSSEKKCISFIKEARESNKDY